MKTSKLLVLPQRIQQLVSEKWWPVLLESSLVANYKKGSYIIRVGERDRFVRLGLSGWTALQLGETILGLASTAMTTNAVGKDLILATSDLVALTDVTAVLFDRDQFTEALMDSPPSGLLTLLSWSARNLNMIQTFSAIKSNCPVDIGLATMLWMLGEPSGDGRRKVPTGIPQQALARALGASREEINRRRKALLDTGYLSKGEDGEYLDAMTPMLLAPFGF